MSDPTTTSDTAAPGDPVPEGAGPAASPGLGRERIRHVIVLMMENRSFDHLLGYLDHPDPDYPGLRSAPVSCPVDPARPDGERVATSDDASPVLGVDPDHSHEAVMLQIYGRVGASSGDIPRMSGFVRSYALKIGRGTLRSNPWPVRVLLAVGRLFTRLLNLVRRRREPVIPRPEDIMRCFPEREAPVLSRLAREFAVLVNWHSSVPGETWPNRNFAHAATSDGTANIEIRFYEDRTVFEQLTEAGRRWRVYHDGLAQVWAFPRLWVDGADAFHGGEELLDHIRADRLPEYSFVEPDHGFGRGEGNSQHPGNNTTSRDSFVAGEALIARIYNALVETPEVFARTLLLVTYDEHGGFFDHVPPRRVPSPDGRVAPSGFDFGITGVRVPAVAISPLVPAGTVDHTGYDHASIPRTVRQQFAPHLGPLTERDRQANDVLAALPLLPEARTDCPRIEVPGPARPVGTRATTTRDLNEFEASLLELGGAVKNRIQHPELDEAVRDLARHGRVAADRLPLPPFRPDPAMSAAARARVMPAASAASRAVDEVVDYFTS
jgi:phospholipase C